MKYIFLLITLISLFSCSQNQQSTTIDSNTVLPELPLQIDLKDFELPVQQQFSQRIKYIALIKKQSADKSKYGWAIGQLAKTYHAYQKTDEARDSYINAIANDPANLEWNYLLAHVYKTIGELDKSTKYFKKVLAIDDYTPAKIWLADVFMQQNKYKQAQALYKEVLLINNYHPMALYNLGLIYQQLNADEVAIKYLLKVLELQPKAYQVHYQLGQLFTKLGQTNKASYHLQKVADDSNLRVSIQFDDPLMQNVADLRRGVQSIIKKAMKASAQGYHKTAIQLLKKAIKANPNRIDTVYNLAIVHLKTKNIKEAKQLLAQIIIQNDDKVYALMAKINNIQKQPELAIANLLKALQLKPTENRYLAQLGDVYSSVGNYIQATQYYDMSLNIDPDQELITLKLVRVLLQDKKNNQQIANLLGKSVFSSRYEIAKKNILTRIYIDTSQEDDNLDSAQIKPLNNGMSYETMAMLVAKKGYFDQAIVYQQKALFYAKKARDKERMTMRQQAYKNGTIFKSIWYPNEALSIN